jgi:hypothetical protein
MAGLEPAEKLDAGAPWAGLWRVEGRMPGGTGGYVGTLAIILQGGVFGLKWDIDDGVYFGLGAALGDKLFVSCSPFEAGIGLAIDAGGAVSICHADGKRAGFLAVPAGSGFGVGPVLIDGSVIVAQHFGGVTAAFGADPARHVLLVYTAQGRNLLNSRWVLGRDPAEGTEKLKRINPPE